MKSPSSFRSLPVIAAAAFAAPSPAAALGPAERAVAQCRAEALGQFGAGEVRSHRIGEIAGNSRAHPGHDLRQCRPPLHVRMRGRAATAGSRPRRFTPARPGGQQLAAGQR